MSREIQIPVPVLAQLDVADVQGNRVKLTGMLSRQLYRDVNKVLEAAGGKWDRKAQAHVFADVEDAFEILEPIILTGSYSREKQDFGVFYTPRNIAIMAARACNIRPGMTVLEPSAGMGALAIAARDFGGHVNCFDILLKHVEALERLEFYAAQIDFLQLQPGLGRGLRRYNRILMNPPFAGKADIKHVMHAIDFLEPGGRLVAIMGAGVHFREDAVTTEFRRLVQLHGGIEQLPPNSFKESGTNVNTVLVYIDKPE